MATIAELITQYIKDRAYAVIHASVMFDDLGLFSVNNNTGRRSYSTGAPGLREVVLGTPGYTKQKARKPLEGLEILVDAPTNQGVGGKAWSKIVFKYTPPRPTEVDKVLAAQHAEKVPEQQILDAVLTGSPPVDLTQVLEELAAIRKASVYTNRLMERLLRAWGDGPATPLLQQGADADETADKKES